MEEDRDPRTLSTAIFNGSGARSDRGVEIKLNRKITEICGQNGRASRSRRRYSSKVLYFRLSVMNRVLILKRRFGHTMRQDRTKHANRAFLQGSDLFSI